MTRNQIEYWKLQETGRANRAQESAASQQLQETKRSNVARETETARSNRINEQQNLRSIVEKERSNKAIEAETNRANLARETETSRSNRVKEAETERANRAREFETNRSNVANETINSRKAAETERSNRANEALTRDRNEYTREHYERADAETNRANLAMEGIQRERNEISRSNIELGYTDSETRRYSSDVAASAARYAASTNAGVRYAELAETTRSNLQQEQNQRLRTTNDYLLGITSNSVRSQEVGVRNRELNLQSDQWYHGQKQLVTEKTLAQREDTYQQQISRDLNRSQKRANIFETWTRGAGNLIRTINPILKGE